MSISGSLIDEEIIIKHQFWSILFFPV